MLKGVFSSRQKQSHSRPFKEYHAEWFSELKNNLLPLLRRSLSGDYHYSSTPTILSTHVEMIHHHFQSYYYALDTVATTDPSQLLHQPWRNNLETPLLWLADLHPSLFTNLAHSFLHQHDNENDDIEIQNDAVSLSYSTSLDKRPWQISMAWRNPSETLTTRMEQIECGLRVIVPTLTERLARAEEALVDRVVGDWFRSRGSCAAAKVAVGGDVRAHMEEVVSVLLYANRLRRSVLVDIVSAATVYQAALFLEGLAEFVVVLRDHELVQYCKNLSLAPPHNNSARECYCYPRCH